MLHQFNTAQFQISERKKFNQNFFLANYIFEVAAN